MPIIELDDFEYHVDVVSALNGVQLDELAFSPIFVFLIDWAVKNNVLGEELKNCKVFNDRYPKLLEGKDTFSAFVLDVLDGKLTETNFADEVVPFIKDYIDYDGYVEDLTKVYATNIGVLPNNFENSELLYEAINVARENYLQNKVNFPDLVVFSDPEQLLKERKIIE